MRWARFMVALLGSALVFVAGGLALSSHKVSVRTRVVDGKHLTVYIRNFDTKDFTNNAIRRDIPSWEKAANGAFSQAWNTPQVKIVLLPRGKRAPLGSISAYFIKSGHVNGALAFHTANPGVAHIVVYSGTGNFYGFNNSVSFTHELFEMLADPTISNLNYGWPDQTIWVGYQPLHIGETVSWVSEVCDPVERYSYKIGPASISDWVTPNWFNDGMRGPLDYMGEASQPLQVLKGGYAQFFDGTYHLVSNFRHAGADAAGFLKGERENGSRR